MKIKSDKGAELLIQAIFKQAISDYRLALKAIPELEKELEHIHDDRVQRMLWSAKRTKDDCERFFCSEYCYGFTGVDSAAFMKSIQRKIRENEGKKMAKMDNQMKNRIEGLLWALRIIEDEDTIENGVAMLRKEIRFRNIVPAPMKVKAAEIRSANIMLTRRVINSMMVIIIKVFDEEYGWKKKRLSELLEKFNRHTMGFEDMDPYGDHYIEISDYAQWFNEQYGAMFSPEAVEEMVQVERENRAAYGRRVQVEAVERILKNSHPKAWEYLKEQIGA